MSDVYDRIISTEIAPCIRACSIFNMGFNEDTSAHNGKKTQYLTFTYIKAFIGITHIKACIGITYIKACIGITYIKACIGITYIKACIGITHFKACIETTILGFTASMVIYYSEVIVFDKLALYNDTHRSMRVSLN